MMPQMEVMSTSSGLGADRMQAMITFHMIRDSVLMG